jgi:hypothetical protein
MPIKGTSTGKINNARYWGKNNPNDDVMTYSLANGSSGRITKVGETLSGIKLDLIYTIKDSDNQFWMDYSGFKNDGRVKGVAFTGEQNIENSDNNSIVVLYNGASALRMYYQIVKHDTFEEVPILVSFITTDVDVGQGVATDLANLAYMIPSQTNLSEKDGVIYDGSHTGPYGYGADLNGASDLPYGGYLGVSFQSHFTYDFYAPAPANTDIYKFATGVRYDLFGSALQTKLIINKQAHIQINYVDDTGKQIHASTDISAMNDFPTVPKDLVIDGYELTDKNTTIIEPTQEIITYIYTPKYTVTVSYVDRNGNVLADKQLISALKNNLVQLVPSTLKGYATPEGQAIVVDGDKSVTFIYDKIYQTRVEYVDDDGNNLKSELILTELNKFPMNPQAIKIGGFTQTDVQIQSITESEKILVFVYTPKYTVTVRYVDQNDNNVFNEETFTVLKGGTLSITPDVVPGYTTPDIQSIQVLNNTTLKFEYRMLLNSVNGFKIGNTKSLKKITYRAGSSEKSIILSKIVTNIQANKDIKDKGPIQKLKQATAKIFKPKRVNKAVVSEREYKWFQKNTGLTKVEQDNFFNTLDEIYNYEHQHGKSDDEIRVDQLYYIGAPSYSKTISQKFTSYVSQYREDNLAKIVGSKEAKNFTNILRDNHNRANKLESINKENAKHNKPKQYFIDLPHMAITAASSTDKRPLTTGIHFLTTDVDIGFYLGMFNPAISVSTAGRIAVEKLFGKSQKDVISNRWAMANGYLGDWITELGHVNLADKITDIDVIKLINSKGDVAKYLRKTYSQSTKNLNQKRDKTLPRLTQQVSITLGGTNCRNKYTRTGRLVTSEK